MEEHKYLKDFVIAISIIMLLVFGIVDYYLQLSVNKVSEKSKWENMALGQDLLSKINNIESSIYDRKKFSFNVNKDPLEQNLIVKTKKDLLAEWEEQVRNMIRLTSTILPETGEKVASFAYQGKNTEYKIGEKVNGRKITDIQSGEVTYIHNGRKGTFKLQPIPQKPAVISNKKDRKQAQYNW
ncbi:MAG: hypothetical protein U9N34_10075 [Candidatus Cloacimonadota bacterium]|nr:hypothetical protein [Candidatus Cloacimonadota bacterium]